MENISTEILVPFQSPLGEMILLDVRQVLLAALIFFFMGRKRVRDEN